MYQYREQYKTNTKHTSPCLDLCAMPATSALQRKYNYKYNQYVEKRQKNPSIHTNTAKSTM